MREKGQVPGHPQPADGKSDPGTGSARSLLPWIAVGVAAAIVRLHKLNYFSYWLDEILQVYTIRFSWARMWNALRGGVFNPPLDYVLLKLLEPLHPSDAARRLLPVAWGTLSVIAFGVLIARRANRSSGLVAAALLAVAPYHVHYSQEVRPYALGLLMICTVLLLLEAWLTRPSVPRLCAVYAGTVAVAYTMYLAALAVAIAGSALLLEDALLGEGSRRRTAMRFLRWSPVLACAVAAAYAPWWSVYLRAMKAAPFTSPPSLGWSRVVRLASYFGFGPSDWYPLGKAGILFSGAVALGLVVSVTTPRLRFLAIWALVGLSTIELLEHRHGVYDSVFHYVPAGIALTGLAALPIASLVHRRKFRLAGCVFLIIFLTLDARGLSVYFRHGRPDWRPVARFLSTTRPDEPILVDSQYTQLCLAYYVVGPDWLCCRTPSDRSVISIDVGPAAPLGKHPLSQNAWLVMMGGDQTGPLRAWSASYPTFASAAAEGESGVTVRHLVPLKSAPND
jgi:hypothetical protein